ncbi:hypothetical protein ACSMXN_02255 [Jatrophihabitans sp. DSM 45814]
MNRDTQPAAIVDGSRQAADRVSARLARDAAERRSERDLALARERQIDLRAAEALVHARLKAWEQEHRDG